MSNEVAIKKETDEKPRTLEQEPRQQEDKPDKGRESLDQKLRRFLVRRPRVLMIGWAIVVVVFLLLIPAAYISWYVLPLRLWEWANEVWWHWIPAFSAFTFLFAIPIWVAMLAGVLTSYLADVSLSIEDEAVQKTRETVRETEQEAINHLEQTDAAGLLPLVKYSRAQLVEYYEVGLKQTRRAFFNSVLAMWLGFILLLVGVALYVGPVEKIGLKVPATDFSILIMGGAAIIEFISALFLWVYRSSIAQLEYFYNRQMYSHTSILCFRIATTMEKSQADDTKRAIVEKALDWTLKPERPALVGGKGLRALLPLGGPKAPP
jgi:hypothetical protein